MLLSMRDDPAADAANVRWTRDPAAALGPWTTGGAHVNEAWDEEPRATFGANYGRPAGIKRRYDPTNRFRHNTNIPPASHSGDAGIAGRPGAGTAIP